MTMIKSPNQVMGHQQVHRNIPAIFTDIHGSRNPAYDTLANMEAATYRDSSSAEPEQHETFFKFNSMNLRLVKVSKLMNWKSPGTYFGHFNSITRTHTCTSGAGGCDYSTYLGFSRSNPHLLTRYHHDAKDD